MDYSEDDEYIEKLTDAFVDALAEGDADGFELDDLLDIYDYACDSKNEYVRISVLIVACNKWPDNVELNERMAVGIYSRGDYDGARAVLENVPDKSRLKQMLLASMDYGPRERIEKRLDGMLENVSVEEKLTDEEVIRLVEIIDMHGLYDWAEKRFDRLKALSEFPDTLMNELAEILRNRDYSDFRRKVLEEFVQDYPLLHYSWSQLADYYLNEMSDPELAENAVDNALAIAPENYMLRAKLAELTMYRGTDLERSRRVIDSLYADYPDKEEAVVLKGVFDAFFDGKKNEGEEILKKGMKVNPDSADMLVRLLMITDGQGADEEVDGFVKHYVSFMDNPDELLVEFDKLMDFGSFRGAAKMGVAIKRLWNGADKYFFDDKIGEALYRSGDYESVVKLYTDKVSDMHDWPDGLVLVYLLSLEKTGSVELCSKLVDELLDGIVSGRVKKQEGRKVDENLRLRGLTGCLTFMQKSLKGENVDERLYNPFIE